MKGEKSRLGHLLRIFHFAMNGPGSNFFPVDTDCCLSFCCLSFFFSFPCLVVPTSRQGGGFCAAFFWGDCTPSPLWYQATKQPSNRQRGRASLSLSLSFLWCPLWGGLGCTSLVPFTQAWYPSSKQPGNRQRGRPPPHSRFSLFSLFFSLRSGGGGWRPQHHHTGWCTSPGVHHQSVSQSGRQAGGRSPASARAFSRPPPPPPPSPFAPPCVLPRESTVATPSPTVATRFVSKERRKKRNHHSAALPPPPPPPPPPQPPAHHSVRPAPARPPVVDRGSKRRRKRERKKRNKDKRGGERERPAREPARPGGGCGPTHPPTPFPRAAPLAGQGCRSGAWTGETYHQSNERGSEKAGVAGGGRRDPWWGHAAIRGAHRGSTRRRVLQLRGRLRRPRAQQSAGSAVGAVPGGQGLLGRHPGSPRVLHCRRDTLPRPLSLHPTRRTPPRPTRPRARKEGGAGERERESSLAPPARLLSELCEAPGRRPPSPLANSSTLLLKVSLQGNSSRWRAQAHHRTCRHAGVRILVNASVVLHTASQGPSAEPVSFFSLPREKETRARLEKLATRHSCLE